MAQSKVRNADLIEKINTVNGGTNMDTSASTGIPQLSSGTWSVTSSLANGTSGTTQSANTNNALIATTSYVDSANPFPLISSQIASNSPSFDFTGLTSGYTNYRIIFNNLVPAGGGSGLYVRMGTGSTPTYITASTIYSHTRDAGAGGNGGVVGDPQIVLAGPGASGVDAFNGEFIIYNPSQATNYHYIQGTLIFAYSSGTNISQEFFSGILLATTAVTAIRIYPSTGNWTSGSAKLYGIR